MPSKKIFSIAFPALAFLVVFFLSANLTSRFVLRGETITIPNLYGKTVEDARAELAKKKLSLALQGWQFSTELERGRILYQEPPSGSRVRIHKAVKVIACEGSEKVRVPKLAGRSLETGSQHLDLAGLIKGKISHIHTSRMAAGKIIAQQPPADEEVARHSAVNLLVSQGEREEKYLMPDLIEKHGEFTIFQLRKMDFKVADIRYAYYPGLGPGIIIKQFPPPGYLIQRRNLITLEISK
jgi:serine/threonine-protein kinase